MRHLFCLTLLFHVLHLRGQFSNIPEDTIDFNNPKPGQHFSSYIQVGKSVALSAKDKIRIDSFISRLEDLWNWQCLIEIRYPDKNYARRVADNVRQYVISLKQAPQRFLSRAVRSEGSRLFRLRKRQKLRLSFILVKKFRPLELSLIGMDILNPAVGQCLNVSYLGIGLFSEQYNPHPGQLPYYDTISRLVNRLNNFYFQLEDHSDCRDIGNSDFDYTKQRAIAIKAFLAGRGADTSRIRAVGKGESELLIDTCECEYASKAKLCTEREHQLNRRVMLRIVGRKDL